MGIVFLCAIFGGFLVFLAVSNEEQKQWFLLISWGLMLGSTIVMVVYEGAKRLFF